MDSIFREAAVILLLVNEKGEVVDINKSGEVFSGRNRKDVLGLLSGHAINCITTSEDENNACGKGKNCGHCVIRKSVKDTFSKNQNFYKKEGTVRIASAGGSVVYDVLVSSSLINYNGERMALITLDDITKQKAIEKELKDINAMKDKFFSLMAHDLKNSFNSILGYSELIKEQHVKNKEEGESKMFADYLHNSSIQAYTLLEDLLTWARLQMNRISVNSEFTSISDIIDENIKILNPLACKKNITLNISPSDPLNVWVDKLMISTVIRNILGNAIKFTNENGKVDIRLKKIPNNFVRVEIQDNGIGISKDVIDKLFKIEKSYTSVGTNGEKGTGLGLILCKEFIEKNKGQIGVESEYGKGSTFWFTLPLNNTNN